jgi:uncharacterized protein
VDLFLGALTVVAASFLGGMSGFGYQLVATPLLLLTGFSLPFVVTANLAVALVTRASMAYRLRAHVDRRRVTMLIAGSAPGLWLGAQVLGAADQQAALRVGTGLLIIALSLLLAASVQAPPPPRIPGASLAAGFAGGFLGATTSLQGVIPVLLLTRDKVAPRSFLADISVYVLVSAGLALAALALEGVLATDALWPTLLVWLPGALGANWVGTTLGPRLPERTFRRLTLTIVFVAGAATALTA